MPPRPSFFIYLIILKTLHNLQSSYHSHGSSYQEALNILKSLCSYQEPAKYSWRSLIVCTKTWTKKWKCNCFTTALAPGPKPIKTKLNLCLDLYTYIPCRLDDGKPFMTVYGC